MNKQSRPKIVVNMTTLNQGGVLQRACSFISNIVEKKFDEFDWELYLSPTVKKEIDGHGIQLDVASQVFPVSPAKNLKARKKISNALNACNPELVFTFAGPSYLRHQCLELMGVADGWVTHSDSHAFKSVPGYKHRLGLRLSSLYKLLWFRRSHLYTNQTQTGKNGIVRRFGVSPDNVFIIPNALADWYQIAESPKYRSAGETIGIFYFSGAYSHKRHDMLPFLCRELERRNEQNFQVMVTLPADNPLTIKMMAKARQLGVESRIVNFGSVPVTRGMELYEQSHICFIPSVLETFSATYLEGMATRTPIVASDFSFAKEICGDAALYFSPNDPADAADKILKILNDRQLNKEMTDKGTQQLQNFPNVAQQMEMYRNVFHQVLKQKIRSYVGN